MTEKEINELKNGTYVLVPKWDYYLKYTSLLGVIVTIFYIGAWTSSAENRMFDSPADKTLTKEHLNNLILHPNDKEVEDKYVTRREYIQTLVMIQESLKEIKDEQKKNK